MMKIGNGHRHQHQNEAGNTAVGARGFDLPLEAKTLSDDVRELGENLTQIAAGLLLQKHGGDKESDIQQGNQND